jgi:hypothetical protein
MKTRVAGIEGEASGSLRAGKTRITIRLDNEILEWFRQRVETQGGGSYQGMINDALRDHIHQGGETLEALLRRVIREELTNKDSEGSLFSLPPGNL